MTKTRDTSVEELTTRLAAQDPKVWVVDYAPGRILERVPRPETKKPIEERTNGVPPGYGNFHWIITYEWGEILRVVWADNEIHEILIRSAEEERWFSVYAWLRGYQGGPWWLLIGKVLSDIVNEEKIETPSKWEAEAEARWAARAKEFSQILLMPVKREAR